MGGGLVFRYCIVRGREGGDSFVIDLANDLVMTVGIVPLANEIDQSAAAGLFVGHPASGGLHESAHVPATD